MKKFVILSQPLAMNQLSYLGGIVSSSAVVGTSVSDFSMTGSEVLGVRNPVLERHIEQVKKDCLQDLCNQAKKNQCDTLYDLHYECCPLTCGTKTMLVVNAYASIGIRNFEVSMIEGYDVYTYEKTLNEYQERICQITRDLEFDDNLEPFIRFVETCSNANVCDELLKDIFAIMMKTLHHGFSPIIETYFNQCSTAMMEMVFFAHMHANHGEKLLELRRKEGFTHLIQYMCKRISYQKILQELKRGDEYLDILVLHPLLAGYKQFYNKDDQAMIPHIIEQLKKTYYHESIDTTRLSKEDKICRCGRILFNGANCSCGARTKINLASYLYKEKVIKHLEMIAQYLEK